MTTHTLDGWKTDGEYGLFTRTRNNERGKGGGREVRVKEENDGFRNNQNATPRKSKPGSTRLNMV